MATATKYPDDGSAPQSISVDLSNVNVTSTGLQNIEFFATTGQSGYDVFDGSHGGNNMILTNPNGDPNYQGGYFYSGAQVGNKFLLQPTVNGGASAPNLAALTPSHLDISLSSDGKTYNVTSTYTPTGTLTVGGNSIDLTGTKFTIGPDANGNPTMTWLQDPNSASGFSSIWNTQVAVFFGPTFGDLVKQSLLQNNLVPVTTTLSTQAELPYYNNTKITIVSANVPGQLNSTGANALGVPSFTIPGSGQNDPKAQNGTNFLVASQALPKSAYLDLSDLYDAIQNSTEISNKAKTWLLQGNTVRLDTPLNPNSGASTNSRGTSNRLFANIISYGVAATFSGRYLTPVTNTPVNTSNGQANRWDAYNDIHGLWLTDANNNPNPNLSQSDFNGIIDAIDNASNVGIPLAEYACFLSGSLIRTPHGAVPVEKLKVGDEIMVANREGDGEEIMPIRRVDHQSAIVNPAWYDDRAGWPVCVCKGAFAQNVPSEDLYVTAEHCFFFDDGFIPVRMLVNGRSIYYDYSQTRYDYYHIETEQHSVIWANDTPTESWLDTQKFRHTDPSKPVIQLQKLTWAKDAAYPLKTDHDTVRALYDQLTKRCDALGLIAETQKMHRMTDDPDLHLETAEGQRISPLRRSGNWVLFRLPSMINQYLQLCSHKFRPCDAVGPYLDDRRELGVLVGRMELWDGHRKCSLTSHLCLSSPPGWDVQEPGPHRWTQGRATLPLPEEFLNSPIYLHKLLAVEILAGGPYLLQEETGKKAEGSAMHHHQQARQEPLALRATQ